MSKDDSYWQGYIQKQNEAMEICKQCKYRKKANKYDSLVKKIEKTIEQLKQEKVRYPYIQEHKIEILQEVLKENNLYES